VERNIATKAIVLSSERSGNADRRFRLLSEDLGIIYVTSFGARKSNKAVKVGFLADGTFFLYHNPVKHSYTLNDVGIDSSHTSIVEDLDADYTAMCFCELLIRTNGGDQKATYRLLKASLTALETPVVSKSQVLIQFIWNLIDVLGMRPDLSCCPSCGRSYEENEILGFSYPLTAPCCQSCATVDTSMLLPPGARRYLAFTCSMSFGQAVTVALSPAARLRIKRYLFRYVSMILGGRPLKTLEGSILQSMD